MLDAIQSRPIDALPVASVRDVLDALLALGLLVLLLPLLAFVAIAIRLEDGGPVLYRQERVGLRGRCFTMLKFRSMCSDAEADGRPRFAAVDDPRVTRTGRIIRRTRIDELPQLVNVLRGEMRLIGPRPERPAIVARLVREVPGYAARHAVKPGLTGLAQVHVGYASDATGAAAKLRCDLEYLHRRSVLLDLYILTHTVRVVLTGSGAR